MSRPGCSLAPYLTIWTAFGVLAYAAALGATELADNSMWVMDNAARIGGGVLILAGLYQLSPLKDICLSKCRAPMAFIAKRLSVPQKRVTKRLESSSCPTSSTRTWPTPRSRPGQARVSTLSLR
jgi:predicted metal-binding membrane protein